MMCGCGHPEHGKSCFAPGDTLCGCLRGYIGGSTQRGTRTAEFPSAEGLLNMARLIIAGMLVRELGAVLTPDQVDQLDRVSRAMHITALEVSAREMQQ